jgi:predicted RNA-binding protein (virulence factor B family)
VLSSVIDAGTYHGGESENKENNIGYFIDNGISVGIVFIVSIKSKKAENQIEKTHTNNYYIINPH